MEVSVQNASFAAGRASVAVSCAMGASQVRPAVSGSRTGDGPEYNSGPCGSAAIRADPRDCSRRF
ncbi:hypothetical protein GCM10009830_05170 [Glycomyces endophyticus]|uniref:Uncharacterized protein n=1 Tax=Glycomyces endophyticus TaxID=480996 RepID=A0ABP4RVU2_9ACTN